MGCQDLRDKNTKTIMTQNIEENDSQTDVQRSNYYNVYRTKFLKLLSEFQHMCEEHLVPIRAARHRIELPSADDRPIPSSSYWVRPCAWEIENLKLTKCWRWMLSSWAKHNGRHTWFVCAQERPNTSIMCGPWQSERREHLEPLCYTVHGRMHRVSWWCHSVIDNGR